jgi:hypothetical protein
MYREVVYFLARARDESVMPSKEHDAYIWATRDEALKLITRGEARVVFLKALRKIQEIEKSLANYRHALDRVERIRRKVVVACPIPSGVIRRAKQRYIVHKQRRLDEIHIKA